MPHTYYEETEESREVSVLTQEVDALRLSIDQERSIRAEGDTILDSKVRTKIDGDVLEAAISTVSSQITEHDSVQSSLIQSITASLGATEATLAEQSIALADATQSLASDIQNLHTTFNTAEASLQTQIQTLTNDDIALSAATQALAASTDNFVTSIQTQLTAISSENRATSVAQQSLSSSFGALESVVTTNETTAATARGTTAQSIDTLTSSLNNSVSSITQTLTTHAGRLGVVEATGSLVFDVNGRITGWKVIAGATYTTFDVLADKFRVVTPGETPAVPFVVTAAGIKAPNLILSGRLSAAKIETSSLFYNEAYPTYPFDSHISKVGTPVGPLPLGYRDNTGATNTFRNTNGSTLSIPREAIKANVEVIGVLDGVAMGGAGVFNKSRLGTSGLNLISIAASGIVTDRLTIWFRKPAGIGNWLLFGSFRWDAPAGAEVWHTVSGRAQRDISVLYNQTVEFGINTVGPAGAIPGSVAADEPLGNIWNPNYAITVVNF